MKTDSVRAYTHMKRDISFPMHASLNILDDPIILDDILKLSLFEYGSFLGLLLRRGRGRSGGEDTNEQPLPDKPPLKRCGETYST